MKVVQMMVLQVKRKLRLKKSVFTISRTASRFCITAGGNKGVSVVLNRETKLNTTPVVKSKEKL